MGAKSVISDYVLKMSLSTNPGEARWGVNRLDYGWSTVSEGQTTAFFARQTCPVCTDGLRT